MLLKFSRSIQIISRDLTSAKVNLFHDRDQKLKHMYSKYSKTILLHKNISRNCQAVHSTAFRCCNSNACTIAQCGQKKSKFAIVSL